MGKVSARLLTVLSASVVAAVSLSGCSTPVKPTTSPVPTSSPVFASDAQALAAAEKAYAAYLKVSDQIAQEGGANPERIADYAIDGALSTAQKSFGEYRAAGARSTGSTAFDHAKLQSASYDLPKSVALDFYVCDDVSGVDVLDESGRSLVSPSRPARTPFEVEATMSPEQRLVISSKTVWTGQDFCK